MQNINGVRPHLNCNICNTGDIHINGLEGAYTIVMIDGMPMMSSLGTVYGLSRIPNTLVERIEIVKGPASSLYGSEAVGGLINIITKNTTKRITTTFDYMSTQWGEHNLDLGINAPISKKINSLTGVNYFVFDDPIDTNNDNFTDVTQQNRVSIFQKINVNRSENRAFSLAARYLYEDRWGGETHWNKQHRGGEHVYGESIYTNRAELFGIYQLPTQEKFHLMFSFINHYQDSRYGNTSYIAQQKIGFGQIIWDKKFGKHDLLAGAALRYNYYDDNTTATLLAPSKTYLPAIFVQDEISLNDQHQLLLGARYDYHQHHKNIFTPRIAYKWSLDDTHVVRINAGTGFRVVNLFSEDHAALTGARDVIIKDQLAPEKSYNVNLNYAKKFFFDSGSILGIDFSAFYTHFTNRIVPDYTTNKTQIIYDNNTDPSISKGISANIDLSLVNGFKLLAGATLMENKIHEQGRKIQQMLTEKFTTTWSISYTLKKLHLNIDYTGNLYGPMRLPTLGDNDPRPTKSTTWSIQNIQFTFTAISKVEIYAGVKNLLNWRPSKNTPFLIARAHDPFDKQVLFDDNGQPLITPENPYGLTFDPSYIYAPNQGIRTFIGLRMKL